MEKSNDWHNGIQVMNSRERTYPFKANVLAYHHCCCSKVASGRKKNLPYQEEWISSHSNIWEQPKKFLTEHVIEILQLVEILEIFTSLSECLMHGSNEGSKVLYTWP